MSIKAIKELYKIAASCDVEAKTAIDLWMRKYIKYFSTSYPNNDSDLTPAMKYLLGEVESKKFRENLTKLAIDALEGGISLDVTEESSILSLWALTDGE